jgi:hypothetical protein
MPDRSSLINSSTFCGIQPLQVVGSAVLWRKRTKRWIATGLRRRHLCARSCAFANVTGRRGE